MAKKKTKKEYLIVVEGSGIRSMWNGNSLEDGDEEVYLVSENDLKSELANLQEYMDEDITDIEWSGCIVEVQEYNPKCYVYKRSTLEPL